MEHISNLINTSSLTVKQEEGKYNIPLDPHVTEVVNKIFVFFYSICRGFDKQYKDPKRLNIEKTQWIRAFMDIGFNTLEKTQRGVKKCRLESPINTPTIGQFVKWCTPTAEEFDIPSLEFAYDEACRNSSSYIPEKKWTHKVIYNAWKLSNSFDLSNLPKKITFPIFERTYHIVVKKMISGEPISDIPVALTHDKESELKQEVKKGFEHCNRYETAKAEIERILGKKINGSSN